jgi:hypothetical protein
MEELLLEGIGGLGMMAISVMYTKWQTNQNKDDIQDLKKNLIENEKLDAIRDTKIAVMESQSNTILTRLDKMEVTLEKIFDRIEKIK